MLELGHWANCRSRRLPDSASRSDDLQSLKGRVTISGS